MSTHCAKMTSFNPHNNSMRKALLLFLFYRLGNQNTARSMDLFKVTEVTNSGAWCSVRAAWLQSLDCKPLTWKEVNKLSLRAYFVPWCCASVHDVSFRYHGNHITLVVLSPLWLWKRWLIEMRYQGRLINFEGDQLRFHCKIPHLSYWGRLGWNQWGVYRRIWYERCCEGRISRI